MLSIGAFARLGQVSPRTLRHYDDVGLLVPQSVDPATGYRSYVVAQLARLHRILVLRDLGFPLDQISSALDDDVDVEELRGMLRLRRAEIEAAVTDEEARLRRVEARLRLLERSGTMPAPDIVVKTTPPLRVAEMTGTASDFGQPLKQTFMAVVPKVLERLAGAGARPGMLVAWYEEPADDGTVTAHIGFDIGDQAVPSGDGLTVHTLPTIDVASVVHKGSMDDAAPTYEALVRWVEDSGYWLAGRSRELYLEFHDCEVEHNITELQMPIAS